MPAYFLQNNDQALQLADTPFASGGEGNLYRIQTPAYQQYIAKIYHVHKQTSRRESKLQYLVKNPPRDLHIGHTERLALAWPQDLVYDEDGKFVGFVMPYMEGEKLEALCTAKLPKRLQTTDWRRFDFANKDALKLRQKLCFNIAAALHNVHETGRYVMIDLKPDNILVRPDGLISLVDMDSIAVVHGGATLFDAPVATPEYTPPESYRQDYRRELAQQETWDRFSLSVIFYKLLFGIHPYAATCKAPFDKADTLDEKIKHGLFVHTQTERKEHFSIVPQPHRHFNRIHISLRELFLRCFDAGVAHPGQRPRAEEWCYAILTSQQAQETYALPSELFDIPALPYADKSFQKLFDAWHQPQLVEPNLVVTPPTEAQLIRFSSYGIAIELRLINSSLFVISWVMLFITPFTLYSGSLLWIVLIVVSSHDIYGYFFRSERSAKLQAMQKEWLLKKQYERDLQAAKQFFQRILNLWQPLQDLYERIPLDKVRRWLTEQSVFRRRIEAFKHFLEQQDIQTQKIIETEEAEAKTARAQQQRQLLEDPFLVKLQGATVSQKLQSLLQIENQDLEQVEEAFAERKQVFELHIEKHRKIAELNEQESQFNEVLDQLRNQQAERIEQETKQKRQQLLEHKRRQVMGTRNDIRANAPVIFSDFDSHTAFIYQFIDKFLMHEGIIEATQIRNVLTSLPAKEFYWEDKTHLIYLRDRTVKVQERYDKNQMERALTQLFQYAQQLEKEVFSTQLSTEEEYMLDADYRQRMEKNQRRVREKEAQLADVLLQKDEILAQLSAQESLSLDQLEREYNEAIREVKERYQEPKNFLRECMEQLVQDRKNLSQQYIHDYEKLVENCRRQHDQLNSDLAQYTGLLQEEDHQRIQQFLQLQGEHFPQLAQLDREFKPIQEQLQLSARQYTDAQYQLLRYAPINFKNHLRQLFLLK